MGWRESYAALIELFPQVDFRLIKGAALEHGDDVGEAAEYILNEIIAADDEKVEDERQDNVQLAPLEHADDEREAAEYILNEHQDTVHLAPFSAAQDVEQSNADCVEQLAAVHRSDSNSSNTVENEKKSGTWISNRSDDGEQNVKVIADHMSNVYSAGLSPYEKRDVNENSPEHSTKGLQSTLPDGESGVITSHTDHEIGVSSLDNHFGSIEEKLARFFVPGANHVDGTFLDPKLDNLDSNIEVYPGTKELSSGVCEFKDGDASSSDVSVACRAPFVPDVCRSQSEPVDGDSIGSPLEAIDDLSLVFASKEDHLLEFFMNDRSKAEFLDMIETGALGISSVTKELDLIDIEPVNLENQQWLEYDKLLDADYRRCDSVLVSGSTTFKNEPTELDSTFDSMLSIVSVDGLDGLDWESIQSSSIHLARMETLVDLVEQAKSDKDVLINSIEEIRLLKLKTDQAEYSARQSKEEAARGGLEVLSRVEEMRKMLARAQEANAVHAGEVYGEKAVLATEARELRSRLIQVKAEKAKALSALNEIKASLQARIDIANRELEAAEQEKMRKEALAREVLAREEALVAKVAQESRDLVAEAESCTKLREFLIDRGSIVDALQGEVAVLCEDAEALKKDLDGMVLSCSGSYVHMLSRASSDMYISTGSKLSKLTETSAQISESLGLLDGVIVSSHKDVADLKIGPTIEKINGDKKVRSSLPSLFKALSSSQDLSSSSHSSHGSSAATNSLSSSRIAVRETFGYYDQLLGDEEMDGDVAHLSKPTLPTPADADADADAASVNQEFPDIQMPVFPGEEVELEYSGSSNLDVFRSHKTSDGEKGSSSSDDDWQLLDSVRSGNIGSGSTSSSDDC